MNGCRVGDGKEDQDIYLQGTRIVLDLGGEYIRDTGKERSKGMTKMN